MTEFDPEEYIRNEHDHHPSVDDQVRVPPVLWDESVTPAGQEQKRKQIAELLEENGVELDHSLKTVLDNLEELDIVESFHPHDGARWFPISERLDDIIFGEYEEMVETEQGRFIRHMQADDPGGDTDSPAVADGGVTVRSVLADHFDVMPENVEDHLRRGTVNEQRRKLKVAIDIVDWHDAVENGDDYDRIVWRHMALRYQLTPWAVEAFTE